jgi:excisionase family DNA binding protein
MTIAEVADCARVNPRTVRRWIDAGQLRVLRIGGCVRISTQAFQGFLDEQSSK